MRTSFPQEADVGSDWGPQFVVFGALSNISTLDGQSQGVVDSSQKTITRRSTNAKGLEGLRFRGPTLQRGH